MIFIFISHPSFRFQNDNEKSRWKWEDGKCLVHIDDNWDGRIEYSRLAPNGMRMDKNACESACMNAKIQACRYTNYGACFYDIKVDKINSSIPQVGPFYYKCEIINDGKVR